MTVQDSTTSRSSARAAPTRAEWVGRWSGVTVVCIASGPSLRLEDCEAIRRSGYPTIVTNTTFRLCPWADVLFGFDARWWQHYKAEVDAVFKGSLLCWSAAGRVHGVRCLDKTDWFHHFHNSGASAISLAISGGALRVILLGYDCQRTDGKTHWHGDHPPKLGNARSIKNWPTQFKNVARYAEQAGIAVLNCTRQTSLTCFPLFNLEEVM